MKIPNASEPQIVPAAGASRHYPDLALGRDARRTSSNNFECAMTPNVSVVGLQHDTMLGGVGSKLELVEISQQAPGDYFATAA
jgi:hypothetical protein